MHSKTIVLTNLCDLVFFRWKTIKFRSGKSSYRLQNSLGDKYFLIIEESYVISIPYQIYNVIGSFSMFLSAKTCLRKSPEFHRFLMIFRSKTGSAIFCESSFFNQKNMFPRSYPQNFGFFRKLNEISFKCIIPEDNPIPELGERTLQTQR